MSSQAVWGIVLLAWVAAGAFAGGMFGSGGDVALEARRTRYLVIWATIGAILLGVWYLTAGPAGR